MGVSWWLAMHQTHTRFLFLTLSSLRSNGFWWIWDQFPCFASGDVGFMKHKNSTIRYSGNLLGIGMLALKILANQVVGSQGAMEIHIKMENQLEVYE